MTAQDKIDQGNATEVAKAKPTGLALLRAPFPPNAISKLPKPTKRQTDEVRNDFKKGIRCTECGQWHHKDVVHLDYVGHAALTDRLLDCDLNWNWEPVAFDANGAPARDSSGGMWIKLTVCGQTRLGYGHADGKNGGDAIKEIIGDALRNAAMRFGAALDLWHKGDLHPVEDDAQGASGNVVDRQQQAETPRHNDSLPARNPDDVAAEMIKAINGAKDADRLKNIWSNPALQRDLTRLRADAPEQAAHVEAAKNTRKDSFAAPPPANNDLSNEPPF